MRNLFLLLVVSAMVCASCTQKVYTSRSQYINRGNIPTNPLVADLKVDLTKKLTGTGTAKGKSATVEVAKEVAIYNAINGSGADMLVDPICNCTIKPGIILPFPFLIPIPYRQKKVTCEVTGYFAVYTNIHTASDDEVRRIKDLNGGGGAQQTGQNIVIQTRGAKGLFGK